MTLQKALVFQESFGREKAKINWYSSGDRNTAYFHRISKVRAASNSMSMLKLGDLILVEAADIEQYVLEYYSSLYSSDNNYVDNGLIDSIIPKVVSDEDNKLLSI